MEKLYDKLCFTAVTLEEAEDFVKKIGYSWTNKNIVHEAKVKSLKSMIIHYNTKTVEFFDKSYDKEKFGFQHLPIGDLTTINNLKALELRLKLFYDDIENNESTTQPY